MSDIRNPGDAWVTAADGQRYWGRFGAAGLLAYDQARHAILLQHRVDWSDHGGTWGIPGGARHEGESAVDGAIRESHEEAGVPHDAVRPTYTHVLDRGGWTYTTVIASVTRIFEPEITDAESHALAWVPVPEVEDYLLHPGFAASWPLLRPLLGADPTFVVDAMNVVGAVPDGWWKDRRAANERLRDRIALLAPKGVPAGLFGLPQTELPGIDLAYPEWLFITEGVARGIDSAPSVRVIDAPELGDDEITEVTRRLIEDGHRVTVFTSDAELRTRVKAVGATGVRGSAQLVKRLPELPEG